MIFDVHHPEILDTVARALAEDIGAGDITSEACIPADMQADGRFFARQHLILAGIELLPLIFDQIELFKRSGTCVQAGEALGVVHGPVRYLLSRERVSLNFIQRLSGVATMARRFVDAVAGTGCKVLDTRKTAPGLRRLEKMAAAAGGVRNHRMGLYDAILVKNNHIAAAGGIRAAFERAKKLGSPQIEVRTRAEIDEALACGATRLLVDNVTPEQAAIEIRHIAGRAVVELSGNITLENVRAYAKAGADFLSSGAITHSATAVDINFRLEL
jgi:nicotinate-nucleotide pyrophosphorylase (carboxylating)